MKMKPPSTSTFPGFIPEVVLHIQGLHGCSFQGFTSLLRQRWQLHLVPSARRHRRGARGGRGDGWHVDLLLCHISGHGSQVAYGVRFVFISLAMAGKRVGKRASRKTGKDVDDVDGRLEGKRVEIRKNESLMWDFLKDTKGKPFFDKYFNINLVHMDMKMKNPGVSMPEIACMFYKHHRCLKINVMSQLLDSNYPRPQTNFIIMFQSSSQVPSIIYITIHYVWFHTWFHMFPSNPNPWDPRSYLWLAPPLVAAACYGFGNLWPQEMEPQPPARLGENDVQKWIQKDKWYCDMGIIWG